MLSSIILQTDINFEPRGKTGLCFTKEQTTNNAHILKLTNVYLNFNKIYMNFIFFLHNIKSL